MNVDAERMPPVLEAVIIGIIGGVLVRIGIFANNFYYPDIGMPYTLGLPGVAIVVVGVLVYLFLQ